MAVKREHVKTEETLNCYAVMDGKRIALTPEQRRAWNEMVNRNRRYARNFGTCGQADYRRCCGDCGMCPYKTDGAFIYADDSERYADGFASGRLAPANPGKSVEQSVEDSDTWSWLYREADRTVRRGRDILSLYFEEGLSAHQIADRTGIAKSTVVDRLNKLLAFIREHRDDLV